jgi:hypothetical protein
VEERDTANIAPAVAETRAQPVKPRAVRNHLLDNRRFFTGLAANLLDFPLLSLDFVLLTTNCLTQSLIISLKPYLKRSTICFLRYPEKIIKLIGFFRELADNIAEFFLIVVLHRNFAEISILGFAGGEVGCGEVGCGEVGCGEVGKWGN